MPGINNVLQGCRVSLYSLLATAMALTLTPVSASAQFLGPVSDTLAAGRELYRSALQGPGTRSWARAGASGQWPDASSGCSLSGNGWTWPNCRPTTWAGASDAEQTLTTDRVRASIAPPDFASPACIGEAIVMLPAFSRCVAAGARAQTAFGENKVYAVARFGFEDELDLPNTETAQAFDTERVTVSFDPSAFAESEWVGEFTPTFTDYINLSIGVEMHPGVSFAQLPRGSGTFTYALFEKPVNLIPPPLRAFCDVSDPSYAVDDAAAAACREGWSFYGRDFFFENEASNADRWGWSVAAGGSVDVNTLGVTPVPLSFDLVAGTTYSLVMNFTAFASMMEESNFWGTARLNYFEVPSGVDPGNALSFNCGAGVACAFDVRQAGATNGGGNGDGGSGTAVPEPTTLQLMVGGLALLMLAQARKRSMGA